MSDLQTLVAQEVQKQLAAITADQTTKKVLDFLKNRNSADAYVVETGGTSSNWFRAWSDGFIEQGGIYSTESSDIATIAFLTPFAEAESVRVLVHRDTPFDSSQEWHSHFLAYNVTASNFMLRSANPNRRWFACGY